MPNNYIRTIAIDSSGTKWIGTGSGGIVSFDGTTWKVYNKDNSDLPDNDVWSIAIDGSGTKWFGAWGGGLAAFNENGIINSVNELFEPVEHIVVYPNPAHNQLSVIASGAMHSVSIYNLQGQQVKCIKLKGKSNKYIINVDNLPTGFYILTVSGDKGMGDTKFIKY